MLKKPIGVIEKQRKQNQRKKRNKTKARVEKQRKQKQESKILKCKINANEINALKEKRVRLTSEIELLRVGADLPSVKAEKLHDFLLSHTIEPTEKEPERSD